MPEPVCDWMEAAAKRPGNSRMDIDFLSICCFCFSVKKALHLFQYKRKGFARTLFGEMVKLHKKSFQNANVFLFISLQYMKDFAVIWFEWFFCSWQMMCHGPRLWSTMCKSNACHTYPLRSHSGLLLLENTNSLKLSMMLVQETAMTRAFALQVSY